VRRGAGLKIVVFSRGGRYNGVVLWDGSMTAVITRPNTDENLDILSRDAQYDLACACSGGDASEHRHRGADGKWIYPVTLPNGGTSVLFKSIYDCGARIVYVFDIDGKPDEEQNSGRLLIELPDRPKERKALLQICGEIAARQGFDPESDT